MNITGKLKLKLPVTSGVSQAGREWKKMAFVIQKRNTKTPKEVCFETLNDDLIMFMSDTSIGTEITVEFDVESREFNGKYYSSIIAYKAEVNKQLSMEVDNHRGTREMAQMYNQEYQRANTAAVGAVDDLPF